MKKRSTLIFGIFFLSILLINSILVSASIKTNKNEYNTQETVYLSSTVGTNDYLCRGSNPPENVKIYIVENQEIWNEGDFFIDVRELPSELPNSRFSLRKFWEEPKKGNYDVIVDCNDDQKYNEASELIYNEGFSVIPKKGRGLISQEKIIPDFSWNYDSEEPNLINKLLNIKLFPENEDIILDEIKIEIASPETMKNIEIYIDKNKDGLINPVDKLIGKLETLNENALIGLNYMLHEGISEDLIVVLKMYEESKIGNYSLKINSLKGIGRSSEETITFFGVPVNSNTLKVNNRKTCLGQIDLEITPNPILINTPSKFKISGLNGCDKFKAEIKTNACYNPKKINECEINNNTCEIENTFNPGTYAVCIDKNKDGDYLDFGENNIKKLIAKFPEIEENNTKENEIEEGTSPITGEVIEESNNFSILKKQTPLLILLEITLLLILTMLILIFIKMSKSKKTQKD